MLNTFKQINLTLGIVVFFIGVTYVNNEHLAYSKSPRKTTTYKQVKKPRTYGKKTTPLSDDQRFTPTLPLLTSLLPLTTREDIERLLDGLLFNLTTQKDKSDESLTHKIGSLVRSYHNQEWNKALRSIESFHEISKDRVVIHMAKTYFLLEDNQHNDAIKELESILTNSKERPLFIGKLFNYYINQEQQGQAQTILKALQAKHLDTESDHLNLGALFFKKSFYSKAKREFNLATKLNPHNKVAHEYLAAIYYEERNIAASVRQYLEAIAINQNNTDIYLTIGALFESRHQLKNAIDITLQAIAEDPNNSQLLI